MIRNLWSIWIVFFMIFFFCNISKSNNFLYYFIIFVTFDFFNFTYQMFVMMINCFYGMIDQRRRPAQNLNWSFVKRSCVVVITTTLWRCAVIFVCLVYKLFRRKSVYSPRKDRKRYIKDELEISYEPSF